MNRAYRIGDWQLEVQAGDTNLGYEDWVLHCIESNSELVDVAQNGQVCLLNPEGLDSRLCTVKGRHFALTTGNTWVSPVFDGTFELRRVDATGHLFGIVKPEDLRESENVEADIEEEALDYFGLNPAPTQTLYPTTGYIIATKRESGPVLAKSYGTDAGVCVYLNREDAEHVLADHPNAAYVHILEVVVSSPENVHDL